MYKKYTHEEALKKAADYCAMSERCTCDVENKLADWNILKGDQPAIIQKLKEKNFIDEKRYARAFTRDKFRYNYWGKIKIRMALNAKNISREDVSEGLSSISDEEYMEMIKKLISGKSSKINGKTIYEKKMKMLAYMQGKGYESQLVFPLLKLDETPED